MRDSRVTGESGDGHSADIENARSKKNGKQKKNGMEIGAKWRPRATRVWESNHAAFPWDPREIFCFIFV